MTRFPAMVRAYLAVNRITQKQAAKDIGIGESTLSQFLSDRGLPDFEANMKIIAWIMFGEEE